MARKIPLPTLGGAIDLGPPTIDQARAGLGGRVSGELGAVDRRLASGPGARVRLADPRAGAIEGVVVFASASEHDVWIGEGRLRRVRADEIVAIEAGDPALEPVAHDARRFAALSEGAPVTYLDRAGRAHAGTLLEKCRYGALVRDGAKIVAVGFRRIEPRPGS